MDYRHGGRVKGKPKYPGDDERNDTVDAKLSPQEIVLPRSVTMGDHPEENSARFVHKELLKHKMREGKGMATGGKVSKVMGEFGAGELHSGSDQGPVVRNHKQAVAIALSEARKHGQNVAPKKMAHGGMARHSLAKKLAMGGYAEGGDVQSYAANHPNEQQHTFKSPFAHGGMAYKDGGEVEGYQPNQETVENKTPTNTTDKQALERRKALAARLKPRNLDTEPSPASQ